MGDSKEYERISSFWVLGGAVYVRLLEDACLYNNFSVLVVPAGAVQVQ